MAVFLLAEGNSFHLLIWISCYSNSHYLTTHPKPFNLDWPHSLMQVLEFLANPEDESRHEERQQALMELLQAGGLAQFDEDRLLHLAHTAQL